MTTAVATPDDDGDDELARKREALMARRTKVMFLRNAGATWSAIAAEVGVSEPTVRNDYRVVCRDINNEQPADVVARHRAVIFDIQRANYPAMMRGDKDAAATILRALDREAKLLGLDAPTRILAATSAEDFAAESARLIDRILAMDPDTLKEITRVRRTDPTVINAEPAAIEAGDSPVDGVDGRVDPAGHAHPDPVDAAPPAREPGGCDPGAEGVRGGAGTAPDAPGVPGTGTDAPGHTGGGQRRPRGPVHPREWSNLDDD